MSPQHEIHFGHGIAAFKLPICRRCDQQITGDMWARGECPGRRTCAPPVHLFFGRSTCACGQLSYDDLVEVVSGKPVPEVGA